MGGDLRGVDLREERPAVDLDLLEVGVELGHVGRLVRGDGALQVQGAAAREIELPERDAFGKVLDGGPPRIERGVPEAHLVLEHRDLRLELERVGVAEGQAVRVVAHAVEPVFLHLQRDHVAEHGEQIRHAQRAEALLVLPLLRRRLPLRRLAGEVALHGGHFVFGCVA